MDDKKKPGRPKKPKEKSKCFLRLSVGFGELDARELKLICKYGNKTASEIMREAYSLYHSKYYEQIKYYEDQERMEIKSRDPDKYKKALGKM